MDGSAACLKQKVKCSSTALAGQLLWSREVDWVQPSLLVNDKDRTQSGKKDIADPSNVRVLAVITNTAHRPASNLAPKVVPQQRSFIPTALCKPQIPLQGQRKRQQRLAVHLAQPVGVLASCATLSSSSESQVIGW